MLKLVYPESEKDFSEIRELILEYAESLAFNLGFQDFEEEFRDIPGHYAPPGGRLILAVLDEETVGCVALKPLDEGTCEMKRLYVRPQYRRRGVGKKLAEAIIEDARKIGYGSMRLDTVPEMKAAIALYRSLGFKVIEPYRYNPIEGALFMELVLE